MYTSNPTATYLNKKKELETSIGWYIKTIVAIDQQQAKRKSELESLKDQLYNLEKDYYGK